MRFQDAKLRELLEAQTALRLEIYKKGGSEDRRKLRQERIAILKEMNSRIRDLVAEKMDEVAEEIDRTDDSRKMFQAVRRIKSKERAPLSVQTSDGNYIATDDGKAAAIAGWFEEQYNNDKGEGCLTPFQGEPRPLARPIDPTEVTMAIK